MTEEQLGLLINHVWRMINHKMSGVSDATDLNESYAHLKTKLVTQEAATCSCGHTRSLHTIDAPLDQCGCSACLCQSYDGV